MNVLLDVLANLCYAVVTAVVPILSYYITKFLRAKFEKMMSEKDSQYFDRTMYEIFNLIETVVNSTTQTYVDALKSEGKFTKESQVEALNKTKGTVLSLLSTESKELIATLYGDIDKWIEVQIESTIKKLK